MTTNTTVSELKNKVDSLENEIMAMHKKLEETISKITDPSALMPLKSILHKMACDSIKELITRSTKVSIAEVGSLLREWGIALEDQEIAKRIERDVPPWTEQEHAIVPLRDVTYKDSSIVFPLDGRRISLGAKLLPFATSAVLEEIKDIFEGNLEILFETTLSFEWDSELGQLKIVRKYQLDRIATDDASLKVFERIDELKKKLGPFKAKVVIPKMFKESRTKETKDKTEIPPEFRRIDPDYNPDCIDVLMDMAKDMAGVCYITDRDLWFRVDDVLIWEEPEYSKATYIFKWPELPLEVFIFRTRISTLLDVRKDPDSGYKDKVIHHKNISNWERNLRSKI